MSQQNSERMRLRLGGEKRDFVVTRPSTYDYALYEELGFARREAQAEANLAYACWTSSPGEESYTVYRAAQDRADAAQDQLAEWGRRLAA
jgi:hypothetical protein